MTIYFDTRQWSHPLVKPFHCLCAKSNNKTHVQFECDVLGFVFLLILFVHKHGDRGCCFIFYLGFPVVEIKQFDCKMSIKM